MPYNSPIKSRKVSINDPFTGQTIKAGSPAPMGSVVHDILFDDEVYHVTRYAKSIWIVRVIKDGDVKVWKKITQDGGMIIEEFDLKEPYGD